MSVAGWIRVPSKQNNLEEPKISSERGVKQQANKLVVIIFLLQLDLQTQFEILDFPSIFYELWTLRQNIS